MNINIISNPEQAEWDDLLQRPALEAKDLSSIILNVYSAVEKDGDQSLFYFTEKFDGVELNSLELDPHYFDEVETLVSSELKEAIHIAKENITAFHQSQQLIPIEIETTEGVVCWQESRALDAVGLYIPGGTAPLFSSILMLAIPASIAGCKEIVLCTPPDKNYKVHPAVAYAAKVSGITRIFTIGGAQAVAAMALGTESIPKVQKIFGPGNQYVTAAKQYAQTLGVAIDMPAGPSELLVLCSDNSNPEFVAADLLSQAEHGIDSQVICLSNTLEMLEHVIKFIQLQLVDLPRRDIATEAIKNSKFIFFDHKEKMIEFSNQYAPEHLIIADENFEQYISKIENAGSVFLGNYCPESAGDYASGTNHTLPTAGFAKMYSGVNLDAFVKKVTFQKITPNGIKKLGKTIEVMAEAEGLHAHKNAVTVRLKKLENN